jgi:hypothetical protein
MNDELTPEIIEGLKQEDRFNWHEWTAIGCLQCHAASTKNLCPMDHRSPLYKYKAQWEKLKAEQQQKAIDNG